MKSISLLVLALLIVPSIMAAPESTVRGQGSSAQAARKFNIQDSYNQVQQSTGIEVTAADTGNFETVNNFKASATNKIQCEPLRGANFGGVQIRPLSCVMDANDNSVQSIEFEWCKRPLEGVSCKVADWMGPEVVSELLPAEFDEFTLSLTDCPSESFVCQASLEQNAVDTFGGNELDNANAGQAGADSQMAQISSTATSVQYQTNVNSNVQSTSDCVNQQINSLEQTGDMTDCSGNTKVSFSAVPDQCTPVETCTNTEITTNTFTSSCFSNVPSNLVTCDNEVPLQNCNVLMETGPVNCQATKVMDTQVCQRTRQVVQENCNRVNNIVVTPVTNCTPGAKEYYWVSNGGDRGYLWFQCDPFRTDGKITVGGFARGGNGNCAWGASWVYKDIDLSLPYDDYEIGWVCPHWSGDYRSARISIYGGCNGQTCTFSAHYYSPDTGTSIWLTNKSFTIPRVTSIIETDNWDDQCATFRSLTNI